MTRRWGHPASMGPTGCCVYVVGWESSHEAAVAALEAAGQPVVRITLSDRVQIAQQFFLWEMATAVAGSVIGINAFNQPDVEASKIETRKLTDAVARDGALPAETPFLEEDGVALFTDATNRAALGTGGLDAVIRAHLARAGPGITWRCWRMSSGRRRISRCCGRCGWRCGMPSTWRPVWGSGRGSCIRPGRRIRVGRILGWVLQITCDDARDLAVPGEKYSFGTVKAAQARGDFEVLLERGRRALRVHLVDVEAGLARLARAISAGLA